MATIPFNRPFMTGKELWYIAQAHAKGHLAGDGEFTRRCHSWLEKATGTQKALLTHSCTGALEMAAVLADVGPGDEVIMPSYTFVSTANAFVLRGAVPVFVDIRADTLNIDETKIEAAITPRTKAIVAVHYAGVGCDMDAMMVIANRHGLMVIEDAAQHPLYTQSPQQIRGLHSLISTPLLRAGAVLGVLNVSYYDAHHFTMDEIRLLQALAGGQGQVVPTDALIDQVYGAEAPGVSDAALSQLAKRLRGLLDPAARRLAGDPQYSTVETIRDVGYRLRV